MKSKSLLAWAYAFISGTIDWSLQGAIPWVLEINEPSINKADGTKVFIERMIRSKAVL